MVWVGEGEKGRGAEGGGERAPPTVSKGWELPKETREGGVYELVTVE